MIPSCSFDDDLFWMAFQKEFLVYLMAPKGFEKEVQVPDLDMAERLQEQMGPKVLT